MSAQPPEMEKLTAVSEAGAQAAADADTPQEAQEATTAAMRAKADEVNLKISDQDIERIAKQFVTMSMAEMEARGAFDPPPEPVEPVSPPPAPPAPGEELTTPPPAAPEPQHPPRKPSIAERYFS